MDDCCNRGRRKKRDWIRRRKEEESERSEKVEKEEKKKKDRKKNVSVKERWMDMNEREVRKDGRGI